jgi:hypothetical protein
MDVGILSSTHVKASSTAPLLLELPNPLPPTLASRFKKIYCRFLFFDDPLISVLDALRIVTESNPADSKAEKEKPILKNVWLVFLYSIRNNFFQLSRLIELVFDRYLQ